MPKKWIIAALTAALLALHSAGMNLAQAAQPETGGNPAAHQSALRPAGSAAAGSKGRYLPGDFHNHTTLSDGSTSIQHLLDKSMGYGLAWLGQSGHGGAFSRNGNFDDPQGDGSLTAPGKFWAETPGVVFKGDFAGRDKFGQQKMWKWQIIQDYLYPLTWQDSVSKEKPIWTGLEWNVPGHGHCSTGIFTGQYQVSPGKVGNANAMAQFEYLFDYWDNDKSEGGGQGWTGKIDNIPNTPDAGLAMHQKAVKAAAWMQNNHRYAAYMVPAHIERRNVFNKDKAYNSGYNVEHFRDLNNAGPDVCCGFEGQPGHQAGPARGGFGPGAFPAGKEIFPGKGPEPGGTFGGTGYYCATIGYLWDALLGEGRNWWLFANSDWHCRETPAYRNAQGDWLDLPDSAGDFWPGEYQKDYVYMKTNKKPSARDVLNGIRGGNSFIVQGDLIRGLDFTAQAAGPVAHMGEKLTVAPNQKVTIKVRVYAPDVPNKCPYTFDNPSLAQLHMKQALNKPVLHHVDLIGGEVYGKRTPGMPDYTNPFNTSTTIRQTVPVSDMKDEGNGWKSFTFVFRAAKSCYFRLRGTNLPAGTPYETDADGNPLSDTLAKNITYTHPTLGPNTVLDTDVEAWSDLWFYSNPIFIRVVGGPNGRVNF